MSGWARCLGVGVAVSWAAQAQAARIKVASVKASSSYTSTDASYEPKQVIDGKAGTSWVEGDPGSGLGAWVELDLGAAVPVQQLRIWGGMWYSTEYWQRANRPKQLEVKFSDGSVQDWNLDDTQSVQTLTLPKAVTTTTVQLKIKGSYNGTTWNDTGISEIQVFDATPDERVAVRSYTASTTSATDGDGNYAAANVGDAINDTMWCEGNKDGDGTGEWLELTFAANTRVAKLGLVNGVASDLPSFMKANRATGATLRFDDGSTQHVEVKSTMMPQTISIAPRATNTVRITFDAVARGKEFNDLCVSEAYFQE